MANRKKTAAISAPVTVDTETEVIVAEPRTKKAAPRARVSRAEKKRAEFSDKIEARNLAMDFLEQNPSSLSFDFLVENQLPMYVKNNLKVPGKIVFTIKNSDGKYVKLEIANCSIPQRLDDLLTWGALANAHSLKDSLRQGIILLCSPKDAERELQSDYAKRKTAELNRSKFANLGGSFNSMMETNVSGARGIDESLSTYAIKKMDVTAVNASTATNKMEAIINRFLDGSRTEEDTITEVLDNSRIFAASDWHLLISKVQSKSQSLVNLAKQQLAVAGSIDN